MNLSTSLSQEPVICNLCRNAALRFCNNCHVSLCVKCVSKHVDKHDLHSHDIAPVKDKKIQLVFPKCDSHTDRNCEAYCLQCETPACTICLIGPHKGHDAEDIIDFAETQRQKIKKETEKFENKLQFYQSTSVDIHRKITEASEEYNKVEENLENLRKIWLQEVNDVFDRVSLLVHSKKDFDLDTLAANKTFVQNVIPNLIQTVQCNKEILRSNQAREVISYTNSQSQYDEKQRNFDFDATIPTLSAMRMHGKELFLNFEDLKATLTCKYECNAM